MPLLPGHRLTLQQAVAGYRLRGPPRRPSQPLHPGRLDSLRRRRSFRHGRRLGRPRRRGRRPGCRLRAAVAARPVSTATPASTPNAIAPSSRGELITSVLPAPKAAGSVGSVEPTSQACVPSDAKFDTVNYWWPSSKPRPRDADRRHLLVAYESPHCGQQCPRDGGLHQRQSRVVRVAHPAKDFLTRVAFSPRCNWLTQRYRSVPMPLF
jgi:hypothetical protein